VLNKVQSHQWPKFGTFDVHLPILHTLELPSYNTFRFGRERLHMHKAMQRLTLTTTRLGQNDMGDTRMAEPYHHQSALYLRSPSSLLQPKRLGNPHCGNVEYYGTHCGIHAHFLMQKLPKELCYGPKTSLPF
jgi:hypothetical protein